ncbi:MAG TPA: hypothetical protein VGQ65_10810 [Thermoanaerobaculia bacterium]|jgi:hypothetical protein|nr:hypothetical protein [Thermoanaerobaculia bacterium]
MVVIASAAAGLALWFARVSQDAAPSDPAGSIVATNRPLPADDLRIEAWIDQNRLNIGERATLSLTIENPSTNKQAISNLTIAVSKPAFEVPRDSRGQPVCWTGDSPACVLGPGAARTPLPKNLAPGESLVAVAGVVAHDPGRQSLTITVSWTDTKGSWRRGSVILKPIECESAVRRRVLLLVRGAQSFLKDLALPFVLAGLGYFLKKFDDDRKDAREDAEKEQARVAQTWNLMLPKSHANSEQFYLPIASAVDGLIGSFEKWQLKGEAFDKLFYFFCLWLRQLRAMQTAIGGFYLKNRESENFLADAWDSLIEWVDRESVFSRDLRDRVLLLIEPSSTFATFNDLGGTESIEKARKRMKKILSAPILAELEQRIRLLRLFVAVLGFEMNRPYEVWYGEQEAFPAEKCVQAIEGWNDTEMNGIKKSFKTYLEKLGQVEQPTRSQSLVLPEQLKRFIA